VSKPDIIDNIQTTMSKDYQPIIGEEIKEQVLQVEENITS
jgi:tryptophan synthase beta subunit